MSNFDAVPPSTFHGKKGRSGRKSAYEERQDSIWHEDIWKNLQDVDALEEKIKGKKYAGRDIAALRLLKGDKYVIGKFMDKLVPDLHDVRGFGGGPIQIETSADADKLEALGREYEEKLKAAILGTVTYTISPANTMTTSIPDTGDESDNETSV